MTRLETILTEDAEPTAAPRIAVALSNAATSSSIPPSPQPSPKGRVRV